MRLLFLNNNIVSKPLLEWLKIREREVIEFKEKISLDLLKIFNSDFIVSYNYQYIIKEDVIELMNNRIINLHISYLPWNRGANPNIWSILENTPKGVTIHYIDKGIDTGKILVQKEINFDLEKETLQTSYDLLHRKIQDLFKENWDKIKNHTIQPKIQRAEGSIHYKKDIEQLKAQIGNFDWDIKLIDLKKRYDLKFI